MCNEWEWPDLSTCELALVRPSVRPSVQGPSEAGPFRACWCQGGEGWEEEQEKAGVVSELFVGQCTLAQCCIQQSTVCVCCRDDDFDMETALTEIQTSEAERSPNKSEGSTRYVAKH